MRSGQLQATIEELQATNTELQERSTDLRTLSATLDAERAHLATILASVGGVGVRSRELADAQ